MELLTQLLNALWAQDFETLANPSMIGMLYFVLFMILFLENGLLLPPFAWRQPVDPGRRADRQRRDGLSTNHFAAYRRGQPGLLGELYSGPLAGNTRTVQNWLSHLPHIIINAPITFSINTACRHY